MRNRVIVLLVKSYIAFLCILVVVGTHQVVFSRHSGRLIHRFVSQVDIEVAETFHPCINDNRNTRVAFHSKRLASVQFPFREPSVLSVHIEHSMNHIHLTLRINQSHELMEIAVSIPQ